MNWREAKLSDHFSLGEFACRGKTCCCHGAAQIDSRLVAVLEELRSLLGGPLRVNSGFRCNDHNKEVGGHPKSFHRIGMAADVTSFMLRQDLESWAIKAGEIVEGRLGEEGNVIFYTRRRFLHVDVGHRIAELVRMKE